MSNKKCNCLNSKLFPHRADKCALLSKKKTNNNSSSRNERKNGNVSLPFNSSDSYGETDKDGDCADDTVGVIITEEEAQTIANNAKLPIGNEQCNCMMYNIQKHRKKYCRWKKHLTTVAVVSGVFAAVAAGVAIGCAVEATNDETANSKEQNNLAVKMNNEYISSIENNQIESHEEVLNNSPNDPQNEEQSRAEETTHQEKKEDNEEHETQTAHQKALTAVAITAGVIGTVATGIATAAAVIALNCDENESISVEDDEQSSRFREVIVEQLRQNA